MADIKAITLPDGTTYNIKDDTSGYITSEGDPVFSNSPAAGITSSDITNWNNKVSDDHKWGDVSLNKTIYANQTTYYVPFLTGTSDTQADLAQAKATPTAKTIAVFDEDAYLKSTTPSASDNSTKVATTAYVTSTISGKQDTLVSGTNIKTINSTSLLGSGNISIPSGMEPFKITLSYSNNQYTVDKTNAEITAAIAANKYVYLYDATASIYLPPYNSTKEIIIGILNSAEPYNASDVRFSAIVDDNNDNYWFINYYLTLDEDYAAYVDWFPMTFARRSAASGGSTLSLVNTGDMYTWNNKSQVQIVRW